MEGPIDVSADKVIGPANRAVHMAFSSEVYYGLRFVLSEQPPHELAIADITSYKDMSLITVEITQVVEIPGIRELVQVDNGSFGTRYPIQNEIGPDKTGATRYENFHSY